MRERTCLAGAKLLELSPGNISASFAPISAPVNYKKWGTFILKKLFILIAMCAFNSSLPAHADEASAPQDGR